MKSETSSCFVAESEDQNPEHHEEAGSHLCEPRLGLKGSARDVLAVGGMRDERAGAGSSKSNELYSNSLKPGVWVQVQLCAVGCAVLGEPEARALGLSQTVG